MLKDIKWFYEKGNILETSKCLENAESKSTGFLDSAETPAAHTMVGCETEHTPTSGLRTLSLSGAKLLVSAVIS